MASSAGPLPLLLGGAATAAAGTALAADIAHGDHPAHVVVLGAVVVVIVALRRFGCRAVTAFPAVSAALAAQPVLHLMSKMARPETGVHDHQDVVQHLLVSEAPTAGVQIVVPALAVVAATVVAHLLYLLIDGVRRPLVVQFARCAPLQVLFPVHVRRLGSMLHWCGWAIRAARRGPPTLATHAIP